MQCYSEYWYKGPKAHTGYESTWIMMCCVTQAIEVIIIFSQLRMRLGKLSIADILRCVCRTSKGKNLASPSSNHWCTGELEFFPVSAAGFHHFIVVLCTYKRVKLHDIRLLIPWNWYYNFLKIHETFQFESIWSMIWFEIHLKPLHNLITLLYAIKTFSIFFHSYLMGITL